MDDRQYRFFGTIDWCYRACSGEASVRAFGKLKKFNKAEIDDMLAQYHAHKANPSPMVHVTQHQLDEIVANASLSTIPPELREG